jgi:hypothetical protein
MTQEAPVSITFDSGGPIEGGICGRVKKSEAHALGAGRGVSQANGAAIHSKPLGLCQHEIVSKILKKWKQCGMWGCTSQLWVPGRSRVYGRPYLSFCSITLQHFS